jgi:hypothetical protein
MRLMGAGSWDAGISGGIAGTLELALVGNAISFECEMGPADRLTLPPSGGVVGRHPLAFARLPRAVSTVSRKHLAFAPLGLGWHAWDCDSSHGTVLLFPNGARRPLVAWVPIPLSHKQRFELAATLTLDVRIRGAAAEGTVAARPDTSLLITDAELETAARALVAERRANPANRHVPAVLDLASTLYCSSGTVYNRLRALWDLPAIVTRLGPLDGQRIDRSVLADALVSAYPYLLLDVPGPP